MDTYERRLGMNRAISRRDFLNGVDVVIGASLLPACTRDGDTIANLTAQYYPPAETGMRGSHPGSFEVAHATVRGHRRDARSADEHYDLAIDDKGRGCLAD